MGCQCQKPEFLNDELTADEKKQIKNIEADNDYLSNNNNYYFKKKYIDPNGKPFDKFSTYIFNQINSLREDPQSYIDIIRQSKRNIKMDKSGIKIYKSSVKVALNRGEAAFDEAIEILKKTKPMNKLIYNPDFVVELPKNENDIISKDYLGNKVNAKINNGIGIKSFWKDIVKDEETCFILTVVDDSMKNAGNKRNDILNRDNKYIGISSVKIGKSFACYIVVG
jgi:hypothetical protein